MLDLRFSNKTLSTYHEKFLEDAYPAEVSQEAFSAFRADGHDPTLLSWGRGAWEYRCLEEYRSFVALNELLYEMTMLGMPYDTLGSATRVVRDELRHVELSRRMTTALGGNALINAEPAWVVSDKRLGLRSRILRTVVGSLCVGETMSVRILALMMDHMTDPLSKSAMKVLVSDESFHARFGWSVLEQIADHLGDSERQDVTFTLPFYLGSVERMMASPHADVPHIAQQVSSSYNPFGYVGTAQRREVFHEYVQRDVIARFEELGFKGREAWANRRDIPQRISL